MSAPEFTLDLPPHRQLWLALSGGLDSAVLLDCAVAYCVGHNRSLKVIHVHHGLSPNADDWATHCRNLCAAYALRAQVDVECMVERVTLAAESGIEAQARAARYQVFERYLAEQDLLLMAHHADDQLETLLLRLMRGAGAQGLSGIPVSRPLGLGLLYRPLLQVPRSELECFARSRGLSWVEDESNQSAKFDRNYLRHQVVPLLKDRWPQAVVVAERSAQVLADGAMLNDELAALDLDNVQIAPDILCCDRLQKLSPARQRNVMRFWLKSVSAITLEYRHLETVRHELILAREDAQPEFVRPEFALRRYRGQLFLWRKEPLTGEQSTPESLAEVCVAELSQPQPVHLQLDGVGFDLLSVADPEDAERIQGAHIYLPVQASLALRLRQGGESLRMKGRGRKTLKKLMQETGVPAWLRDRVRLFWLTDNNSSETRLAGVWSPVLGARNTAEAHQEAGAGIFWWDQSVLVDGPENKCSETDVLCVAVRVSSTSF